MEKKNPYKFTLGFDKTKPTHARAVEILNAVRDKADLIASAVVTHIDGGRTELPYLILSYLSAFLLSAEF